MKIVFSLPNQCDIRHTGEYKVLIFGDNYRGISSRSRPPEEESQRNEDNAVPFFLIKIQSKKICNIFQQILISFPIFNTLDLICKCLIVFLDALASLVPTL